MGDIQQYFIEQKVRNYYSVSISGYHIAEAGANPISQLAFTLSNGFTFVEYYLSRGMAIDGDPCAFRYDAIRDAFVSRSVFTVRYNSW